MDVNNECKLGESTTVKGTCFSNQSIKIIAKDLNIKPDIEIIKKVTKCDKDSCILTKIKDDDIAKKVELLHLKPYTESYDGKYWLNNTEIDSCMIQLWNSFEGFGIGYIHMVDLKMFPPANHDATNIKINPVTEIEFGK